MMPCMTPTKRVDMWFKDRSVKTTEYSSSPSGSTSRRGRLTSADCHRSAHRAVANHAAERPTTDRLPRPGGWESVIPPRGRVRRGLLRALLVRVVIVPPLVGRGLGV